MRSLLAAVLIALSGCAELPRDSAYVGAAADLATTEYAINIAKTAHEANLLVNPTPVGLAENLAWKIGIIAIADRKLPQAMPAISGGFMGISAHNAVVIFLPHAAPPLSWVAFVAVGGAFYWYDAKHVKVAKPETDEDRLENAKTLAFMNQWHPVPLTKSP